MIFPHSRHVKYQHAFLLHRKLFSSICTGAIHVGIEILAGDMGITSSSRRTQTQRILLMQTNTLNTFLIIQLLFSLLKFGIFRFLLLVACTKQKRRKERINGFCVLFLFVTHKFNFLLALNDSRSNFPSFSQIKQIYVA